MWQKVTLCIKFRIWLTTKFYIKFWMWPKTTHCIKKRMWLNATFYIKFVYWTKPDILHHFFNVIKNDALYQGIWLNATFYAKVSMWPKTTLCIKLQMWLNATFCVLDQTRHFTSCFASHNMLSFDQMCISTLHARKNYSLRDIFLLFRRKNRTQKGSYRMFLCWHISWVCKISRK